MNVERIPIANLSQDPANARVHPERNLAAITASLRRFGQQTPIVIDKSNVVRKGNGTLHAAIAMGWNSIDCIRTELTSSDAIAYAIADNRTSELAEWDDDILAAQLQGLLTEDEELLDAAGFDEDELEALLGELDDDDTTGEIIEDEVPEPPVDPITKPGDLWILGRHRLLCGDSTKAEDISRLMNGANAVACLTDPPYCVGYENQQREKGRKTRSQTGDSYRDPVNPKEFIAAWIDAVPCDILVFTDVWNQHFHELSDATRQWDLLYECVWVKQHFAYIMGRRFQPQHEPILFFRRKKGKTGIWNVPATVSTIFNHDKPASNPDHPTPKPVALWSDLMGYITNKDDLLYEPFSGSGTTLIAAEQLGRTCYGMEISPQYCDVIVKRWENLTGEKAVCQSKTPD